MGASELHVVMASGFEGGIGLRGGACGALGAAIWLTAMNNRDEGVRKISYFDNPVYVAVIDRFVESTDANTNAQKLSGGGLRISMTMPLICAMGAARILSKY